MTLSRKLLLAPMALAAIAPGAPLLAADMSAINDYMNQQEMDELRALRSKNQVTSINQFSDLRPTDWAYQALSNLIDKYGCVAGYPNGAYKGGQAMARFEAAALLNACLDRVSEQTDELKRLLDEFKTELSVLRGRVDGLEQKVGVLESQQFSTTTKLTGKADMILGGTGYTGAYGGTNAGTGTKPLQEAVSFNYRLTLDLNTSFTGKDLLYTRLRTGNFQNSAFAGSGAYVPLAQLEDSNTNADVLKLDKLWYQFPVGNFTFYLAPRSENYYMLTSQPTVYGNGNFILKLFKDRGAPGVYGNSSGAGAGVNWVSNRSNKTPRLGISSSTIAKYGDNGNPAAGGMLNTYSATKFVTQVAYGTSQWQISTAYAFTSGGMVMGRGTTMGGADVPTRSSANSWALNAFWQPKQGGWIPSVSLGYEVNWFQVNPNSGASVASGGNRAQTMAWMAGLEWADAFKEGNTLGFGIGGPEWVTSQVNGAAPNDGNMAMELWYKFQVTDNIAVTPAIFYLSRPFGGLTGTAANYGGLQSDANPTFGTFGYLLKTTFRF
jgi:hypothetical protein